MDRAISSSHTMKGMLDDDYTLFESGKVLHEFDKHTYPGGQNLKEELKASDLRDEVKNRLVNGASDADKELAKKLLGIV